MICPNCKKSNRCNCLSCNPNGEEFGTQRTIGEDLLKCFWCGDEFTPDRSLDAEWSIFMDGIMKDISRLYVMRWCVFRENPKNFTEFELERAMSGHLGLHKSSLTKEIINGIKRELKIMEII
jgi:hypothetical protein